MSDSTVPAAKAAILTLLQGASGLAGVKVSWGGPTQLEDVKREMVHLGDVEQDEEDRGFNTTTEDYTLDIVVIVRRHGDNEQATETRLWAIRQEIADLIDTNYTLGGVLNETGARVDRTRQENLPTDEGWFSRAYVTVRCRAVI